MSAKKPPAKDSEIDYRRLLCGDLRHSWNPVGDMVLLERKGVVKVFQRGLECMRCSTLRFDTYQWVGHSVIHVATRYKYPAWYHVEGGLKIDRARDLLFRDMVLSIRSADDEATA